VWFKTRTGLVRVEGTAEFLASRFHTANGRWSVGVFAYQARHAEFERRGLLRRLVRVPSRWFYLACFPDGTGAETAVAECMRLIENAIQSGVPICDFSEMGDEASWGKSKSRVFVRWRPPSAGGQPA